MSTALVKCACGVTNRIILGPHRSRCGRCKREFDPGDLARAQLERPAAFDLEQEDDDDTPTAKCRTCSWEGLEEDCDEDDDGERTCPDCGCAVRVVSG